MTEAEVLQRIEKWAGDPQQALIWYKEHRPLSLNGHTMEELIKMKRGDVVERYIDQIESGAFA